jgi:hypothetical protein
MPRKLSIESLYNKHLSDIIFIAVKDIQEARKKKYEIDMDDWGRRNGHCVACFAGHSLLRYTKNVCDFISNNKYAESVAYALNDVRRGDIFQAASELYDDITEEEVINLEKISLRFWNTERVNNNFRGFVLNMKSVARRLKKIGF